MRPVADCLIENAAIVVTCAGPAPRRGAAQGDVSSIAGGIVAACRGEIVYVGPAVRAGEHVDVSPDATRIDATGCAVLPGFVDPHTHLIYGGDRRHELTRRLAGATYAQLAAEGGGILATVRATRAASEGELLASGQTRLEEMLACGTTTCEAKSGYGLTTEAEVKQLRALRALDTRHPVDIVPTFLGAHEIPPEYRGRRAEYVALVVDEMIPRVAAERLAEWCDVFCDEGAFTPDEATTILEAGLRSGLKPRIHAEELAATGGSLVAAHLGARSADHLVHIDETAADALATAGVCAVLLPAAAFYLKLGRFAPARMLVERGVAVSLATDINPGGGFSPSMPFAMTLACFAMGLTLEEALIAATLNAAWSIDRADRVGSLEPGKLMDAVIVNGSPVELLRVGAAAIRMVIKRGKVVP